MTKTKMPKLPMSPTEREWDQYNRQLVQYQKEQIARKDAQIAALKRKVERLIKQFEKERLDFQDWLARS
jgi:flagellar motility protein MotE (MotC chaperone)